MFQALLAVAVSAKSPKLFSRWIARLLFQWILLLARSTLKVSKAQSESVRLLKRWVFLPRLVPETVILLRVNALMHKLSMPHFRCERRSRRSTQPCAHERYSADEQFPSHPACVSKLASLCSGHNFANFHTLSIAAVENTQGVFGRRLQT